MKSFILSLCFLFCLTGLIAQINYHESPTDLRLYPRNIQSNTAQVDFSARIMDANIDSIVIVMERTDGLTERKAEAVDYSIDTSFRMSFEIEAISEDHDFYLFYLAGNQAELVDSFKNIVAGDVFVLQGQSNAQANAYNGDANVWQDQYVRSFGNPSYGGQIDENWYIAEGNIGFVPGSIGQLGIRLARHLRDSLDMPIAIINGAHGGQAIEFFQRNDLNHSDNLTNYGRLLIRLKNGGLINNIRSIIFYQGEADGQRAEIHKNLFEKLYSDWNEDIPNVESFYVVQVREGCGAPSLKLRDYQRLFEQYLPRMTSVTVNGIPDHDGCHYAVTGYSSLAEKFYYLLLGDFYMDVRPNHDIRPLKAWYSNENNTEIILETNKLSDELIAQVGANLDFTLSSGVISIEEIEADGNQLIIRLNNSVYDSLTSLSYQGHAIENDRWILNQFGNGMFSFNQIKIDSFHPLVDNNIASIMSGSGNALSFDGVDDIVTLEMALNYSYTKEAWVFPKVGGGFNNIVSGSNTALWAPSGYGYRMSSGHNGIWNSVQDLAPIDFFKWTHFAVSYDHNAQIMSLYKNGELIDTAWNVPVQTGQDMFIGGFAGSFTFFGLIDEVKIWNKVRSIDEIRTDMCHKVSGSEPNLLAYFRFDELEGNTLPDVTNTYSGTLLNFKNSSSQWVRSSAPIGTSSAYSYQAGDSYSLGLPSGEELSIFNSQINGFTHLYFISEEPNVIVPPMDYIEVDNQQSYGVFFLGQELEHELLYSFEGNAFVDTFSFDYELNLSKRQNNAQREWTVQDGAEFMNKSVTWLNNESQEFALVRKDGVVSISEEPLSLNLEIYPSVAQNSFIINLNYSSFDIEIYDLAGRIIRKENSINRQVRINSTRWNNGLYFIKVRMDNGAILNAPVTILH